MNSCQHQNPNLKTKLAGAAAALAFLITPIGAQVTTWSGGTGAWDAGANWAGGAVPVTSGTGLINDGLAVISPGTSFDGGLLIADAVGSSGTVIVDGQFTGRGYTYVGGVGDGTLIINGTYNPAGSFRVGGYDTAAQSPGGNFTAGAGNGYVSVVGYLGNTSNITMAVGFDGAGRIDVLSTGSVRSGDFYIGDHATASGTLNLYGTWQANGININYADSGTMGFGSNVLNIYSGGEFRTINTGTVKNYLAKDTNSSGIINIKSGGVLSSSGLEFSIARGASSRAEINVDGQFSFTRGTTVPTGTSGLTTQFYVAQGNNSNGTLNIGETGKVDVLAQQFFIATGYGAYGEVNVDGLLTFTATQTGASADRRFSIGHAANNTHANPGPVGVLNIGQSGTVILNNVSETALGTMGQGSGYNYANGTGTANVAGVWITNSVLYVGRSGDGFLNIASTGTVINTNARIGLYSGTRFPNYSEANIWGVWVNNGYLDVGCAAPAALNLYAGGTITTNTDFSVGRNAVDTGKYSPTSGTAMIAGHVEVGDELIVGFAGPGTLELVSGGSINVKTDTLIARDATGSGTLVLNGGVLQTPKISRGSGSSATILFNGGTIRAAADTGNFFVNFPKVDLDNGSLAFDTQAYAVTVTNTLAGQAGAVLDKTGIGTLTLTADSSGYAGTLNVRSGILASGNSSAKLGGNINILDGVVLDIRKATLETTGNLAFANGAVWAYSLDTQNQLTANNLTIAGDGTLFLDLGSLGIGDLAMPATYTLGSYTNGTGINKLDTWTVTGGTIAHGAAIDTSSVANTIKLNLNTADVGVLYWQGGDGNWDASSATWKLSGTSVKWGYGGLGVFESGAGTVTITGIQTFDGLQFDADGYTLTGPGTLAGNSLTGNGVANFNVTTAGATAIINTTVAGSGLYKTGPGSLILGGNVNLNTLNATVKVDGGGLTVTNADIIASALADISITGGGTLSFGGLLDARGGLSIGTAASDIGTLEILDGGTTKTTAFTLGDYGSGVLYVAQNASLTNSSAANFGNNTGGAGSATVDGYFGIGTSLAVGRAAHGYLKISQSGTVKTGSWVHVASTADGSGLVDVEGLWDVGSSLQIGYQGTGTLNIAATGTVKAGTYSSIGGQNNGNGIANVAGLWTNQTHFYLGRNPTVSPAADNVSAGLLNILPTGTVTVGGNFIAAARAGSGQTNNAGVYSTGTANIAGLLDVTGNIVLGQLGSATFDIKSGGTVKSGGYLYIGDTAVTGTGGVTVAGVLDIGGNIRVGNAGSGDLEILSGGTVIQRGTDNYIATAVSGADSRSTLIIRTGGYLDAGSRNGANDANFGVGWAGTGTMLIETGGIAVSSGNGGETIAFSLGDNATGIGIATIDGYLAANNGYAAIGLAGTGTLDLTGTLTATRAVIARDSTSNGVATVAGLFDIATDMYVGGSGTGVLTVQDTGTVTVGGTASIANASTGVGTATVAGLFDANELVVGAGGFGILDIQAGGTVAVGDTAAIGSNAAGSGVVNVAGLFDIGNDLNIGTAGSGMLNIKSGGEVRVGGTTFVGATGTIGVIAGELGADAAKLGGNVIIQSGGMLDLRTGPLSITDNITLENGAFWHYSLTGKNELDVGGTITIGGFGTLYIDPDGLNIETGVPGVYTIANYQDIVNSGSLASWLIMGPGFSHDGVLSASTAPGSITLNIGTADYDVLVWKGGDGDWGVLDTDWRRSGTAVNWNLGSLGLFSSGTGIVTVTDRQTISVLQFDDVDYTFNGPGSLAAYGGNAFINTTDATGTATINIAFEAETLQKTGPGTLVLGGAAKFTDNVSVESGALEIAASGTLSTADVEISATAGKTASVNVAGVLAHTGTLLIGKGGDGLFTIAETGTVMGDTANTTYLGYAVGSTGTAIVSGYWESGQLYIGNAGTGALVIETGGTVNSAGISRIGVEETSVGSALVKGEWKNAGAIVIGGTGKGSLEIASDGNVTADGVQIDGVSSIVTVSGTLHNSGELDIGLDTNGTLIVADGGVVNQARETYVGHNGTASGLLHIQGGGTFNQASGYFRVSGSNNGATTTSGTLIVDKDGTLYSVSNIHIGASGAAEALIDGYVRTDASTYIGVYAGGQGIVTVGQTGTLSSGGLLSLGYNTPGSGTLVLKGLATVGSHLYVGQNADSTGNLLDIRSGGTLTVAGDAIIGNDVGSSGTALVAGNLVHDGGNIRVGYKGTGVLSIAENGTVSTAGSLFYIGSEVGSYGEVNVDGFLSYVGTGTADTIFAVAYQRNTATDTPAATGVLRIGQSGTLIVEATESSIGRMGHGSGASFASASGTAIVDGVWKNSGFLQIGRSGDGVLIIGENGTVTADSYIILGRYYSGTAGATGTVNVAGLLQSGDYLAVGEVGTGYLNIASTGTVLVGGQYSQNSNSTLVVAATSTRTSAYITAERALLSGTLALDGSGLGYAGFAKSSEITEAGVLILNATSGTISGNFTAFTGIDGAGLPDYLSIGGQTKINDDNTASYYAGYRLTWNALTGAHGDFTLNDGETFEVDTPLANRYGELAPGWDGKSLTKKGAGTLILSGQNTFTGTLTVSSGTLRLGGPADHSYNALVNNAVLDFGSRPLGRAIGETYRTAQVSSLDGNGTLRMTANPGTGQSDRLIVTGNATGEHRLIIAASDDATMPSDASPTTVLATVAGKNNATFTGGLDFGGINYLVAQSTTPGQIVLATNGQAGVADPIRGIPGAQSLMWFASQDNLSRRLGELRGLANEPERDLTLWIRARAEQSKFNSSTNMRPFEMDLYGFELGADSTLALSAARLAFGFYLGYGHAEQDFDPRAGTGTADGKSDQFNIGAYASWMHDAGWFSSLTIAIANYDNSFESSDQSGNRTRGDYDDKALGASLEFGKRIALDNMIGAGWFAEPSAQLSAVYFSRGSYDTTGANRLDIDGDSATIARFRGTLRAGRAWHLGSGHIELAARIGGAHETSTGGEVNIGASHWRPNVDGTRGEAGVGLIWRPAPGSQVYFDYEFATGDAYQKPWSISLGYRHAF